MAVITGDYGVKATLTNGKLSTLKGEVSKRNEKHFFQSLTLIGFANGEFYELVDLRFYQSSTKKRTAVVWINTPDVCAIGANYSRDIVSSNGAYLHDLAERLLDRHGLAFTQKEVVYHAYGGSHPLEHCLLAFAELCGFKHACLNVVGG